MAEALLIGRADIVKFTAMNGSVDTDSFIQWIKTAQDIRIQNYLGTDLFEKIQADIINAHIKPMLIHWAMVEYLPFAAYTIANKGVFKHSAENAENVSKDEVDYLVEKERDLAQYYTERFISYMSFNNTLFPEYRTNTNDDINPSYDSSFSGWVL